MTQENHPERESASAGITAAAAKALHTAVDDLESQINQANTQVTELRGKRQSQLRELRQHLRLLREALDTSYDDADARWRAFGFERPIDTTAPTRPKGVTLRREGAVHVLAWESAVRAEYYRIFAEVEGESVEGLPRSVSETSAVLEVLPPQAVVKVSAANGAGESLPSQPVMVPEALMLA